MLLGLALLHHHHRAEPGPSAGERVFVEIFRHGTMVYGIAVRIEGDRGQRGLLARVHPERVPDVRAARPDKADPRREEEGGSRGGAGGGGRAGGLGEHDKVFPEERLPQLDPVADGPGQELPEGFELAQILIHFFIS